MAGVPKGAIAVEVVVFHGSLLNHNDQRATLLGNRMLKVDHAGEQGAICIYQAQIWMARWRAPDLVEELEHFLTHERRHRELFWGVMRTRGVRRCRSFQLCALGGGALGTITGLLGREAISATTVAVERVVLRHLELQVAQLRYADAEAATVIEQIIHEEQEHHNRSAARLPDRSIIAWVIDRVVTAATETVIWIGLRL